MNKDRSRMLRGGIKPALCTDDPEMGRFEVCPYTCRNACLGIEITDARVLVVTAIALADGSNQFNLTKKAM